jgi:lipopolysaccharide export LptBFGC system permease protein LptF
MDKFFDGNYHWIIIIIVAIWFLDKLRPDYETKKEKEKRLKKEAEKNTAYVKKILNDGERYKKNPILYYREIIKDEKYRKIFDKRLKEKKYQKILQKPLEYGKLNYDLHHLAIEVSA